MHIDIRLITGLTDLFVDTAASTVDGPVLTSHDSLDGADTLDITSKSRDLWNSDDNLWKVRFCSHEISTNGP